MKIRPAVWPHSIPWSVRVQGFRTRAIRTEVRRVCKGRGLELALQPILDSHTARPIGYEALARPTGIDAGPADLLAEASRQNRRWAIERAMRLLALSHLPELRGRGLLFLNGSPEVIADPRFADDFANSIAACPAHTARDLVLEVTEEANGPSCEALLGSIERLRKLGVQIAIDDVGAGASGLCRIADLAPDWIKIDRGLVAALDHDHGAASGVIEGLVRLAERCGARLIAEGIERPWQAERLTDLGVRYQQGYLFSRPLPSPVIARIGHTEHRAAA